jgi:2,3-bisphosphoglycerate-independent phosphoglycerate mutase
VKGLNLSANISGTDPLKHHRPLQVVKALDDFESVKHTASVVNEISFEMRWILHSHALNQERLSRGKSVPNCEGVESGFRLVNSIS